MTTLKPARWIRPDRPWRRIVGLAALRAQARADAERMETMLASSTHQRLTEATVRELVSEARTRL